MPSPVELPCSLETAGASAGFSFASRVPDVHRIGVEEVRFERGRDTVAVTLWDGVVHEIGYVFPTRFAFQERVKLSAFLAEYADVDLAGGAPIPWEPAMNTDFYLLYHHTIKPIYCLYTKSVGGVVFGTQEYRQASSTIPRHTPKPWPVLYPST